jgi:hypothetical protein
MEKETSVLYTELQDEAVLLDLNVGVYYGLNEVAFKMWRGIENGESEASLVAMICEEFDVSEETVRNDLANLRSSLIEKGLIPA